jgi:phosphate transport system permease protein
MARSADPLWAGPETDEAMGHHTETLRDFLFHAVCLGAALLVLALLGLLILFLVFSSWPALQQLGLEFFFSADWDPPRDRYGALAFVYGTMVTSLLALLLAVPLGIGAAAFLAEIAPRWLQRSGAFLLELLAAIPSVVYGFWGVVFLAPGVQRVFTALGGPNTGGVGILSASLILALMVLPYITALSYDVCRAVPRAQREAALALGATRWQTIWRVVLPYARGGIVGACFLALGRALGETMAVTMLIGNNPRIELSLTAQGDSIASVIANQLGNSNRDLQIAALVELGLVLLAVTMALNCLARLFLWRMGRPLSRVRFLRGYREAGRGTATLRTQTPLAPNPQAQRWAHWVDRLLTGVLAGCFLLSVGCLFLLIGYILVRGLNSLNLAFFTHLPIETPPGLGHALLGSGLLVGLATLWAVPVGILGAIYVAEYPRGRLVPVVRFVAELLSGVPSVILGIFGYTLIVRPFGFSGYAGAFALGVMMVPIVLRSGEEALKLVPVSLRNASYALGASTWQTISRVVVPAALPAIVTGIFLALARIAGETAPLLLTAYNSNFWPRSPAERTPFLTYYIYYYSRSDDPQQQQLAWAAAVVLLVLVLLLSLGIRCTTGRRQVLAGQAD